MECTTPHLVFYSGLAADRSVFLPQKLAFPNLIVPDWPVPTYCETLDQYARRLANALPDEGRLILGGASFGGIIALHVAEHVCAEAVVLIGSVKSPSELPRYAKWARPLRPLIRYLPVRSLQLCCLPVLRGIARFKFTHLVNLMRQFQNADPVVIKWSLMRILDWNDCPEPTCPIVHIHGKRDHVLPMRYTNPDHVVLDGGHILSLSHPRDVNEFIAKVIESADTE
jgi:pimeloyl-ACP methyl ester carboxylesterase